MGIVKKCWYFSLLFIPTICQDSMAYSFVNSATVLSKKDNSTTSPLVSSSKVAVYRHRKYSHVTKLYQRLYKPVVEMCMRYEVPPAAIMSIISLESGWGRGYVGQITGNFMSLNATKSSVALPALYLPKHLPTGKILYDIEKANKYPAKDIRWEKRPSSLKKDYRPKGLAGTKENLTYFDQNPKALTEANLRNVKDFVSRFISKNSKIKAYREARELLDNAIAKSGNTVLFDVQLNEQFIKTIGGRPNSFNYRTTWPSKALSIMYGVGAVELSHQLYIENKAFAEVW